MHAVFFVCCVLVYIYVNVLLLLCVANDVNILLDHGMAKPIHHIHVYVHLHYAIFGIFATPLYRMPILNTFEIFSHCV